MTIIKTAKSIIIKNITDEEIEWLNEGYEGIKEALKTNYKIQPLKEFMDELLCMLYEENNNGSTNSTAV
jgi:glutathionyl-hydroquinone reductase